MIQMPDVTIVITTYFRNEELERAIESCLQQSYPNIEVVVVDDSGEFHATSVVERWDGVRYMSHATNEGQIRSWQTGLEQATGDYVQFLDDDDVLLKDKIRKQINLLETDAEIGAVGCGIQWDFGPTALPEERLREKPLESALAFQISPCSTSTLLFRKDILDKVLPLDPYRGATDLALWIEFANIANFDFVDEPLVMRSSEGYSKGESWAAVDAREKMITEYNHLYKKVSDSVYDRARADIALKTGHRVLDEAVWSPRAVISFGRSFCYEPSGQSIKLALLSLLSGRYGRSLGRKLSQIF